MIFLRKTFFCFLLSVVFYTTGKAQLFTNLGEQHNQFFVGSGYSESFININYGLNHTRYFKRLKRNVVGIIDFSIPLYCKYYTRFVFGKGFQLDICKKNNFRLPIVVISSTVRKHLSLFDFHNITTNVCLLPGVYADKYTIAGDFAVNFLIFSKIHYNNAFYKDNGVKPNTQHEKITIRAGVVLAYNIKRFSFILRGGFQQKNNWEYIKMPFYAIGTLAYKLNFKKHNNTLSPQPISSGDNK